MILHQFYSIIGLKIKLLPSCSLSMFLCQYLFTRKLCWSQKWDTRSPEGTRDFTEGNRAAWNKTDSVFICHLAQWTPAIVIL